MRAAVHGFRCAKIGINVKRRLIDVRKELFRKSIHICTAFVPLALHIARVPVLVALCAALALYVVAEFLRRNGHEIPLISDITAAAARKRDEDHFVLGPVTLVLGVVATALLWDERAATIGILALAFGDGLASLAGKTLGHAIVPFTHGKTAAGSLTCFIAIFCVAWAVSHTTLHALVIATVGMVIELLPLRDFDNLLIPVALGGVVQVLLPHIQLV